MTNNPDETRVLRPALGRRYAQVAVCGAMLALSINAARESWVGIPGIVFSSVCGLLFLTRAINRRAGAVMMDSEHLMTFTPVLGRPMQTVRWADIAGLTYCAAYGWRGQGSARALAWVGHTVTHTVAHPPWTGGVNDEGQPYDGAVPNGLRKSSQLDALFESYLDRAKELEPEHGSHGSPPSPV